MQDERENREYRKKTAKKKKIGERGGNQVKLQKKKTFFEPKGRMKKNKIKSIRHIFPWVLRSIFIIITKLIHRFLSCHHIHPTTATTRSCICAGIVYIINTPTATFATATANRFFVRIDDFFFKPFFNLR